VRSYRLSPPPIRWAHRRRRFLLPLIAKGIELRWWAPSSPTPSSSAPAELRRMASWILRRVPDGPWSLPSPAEGLHVELPGLPATRAPPHPCRSQGSFAAPHCNLSGGNGAPPRSRFTTPQTKLSTTWARSRLLELPRRSNWIETATVDAIVFAFPSSGNHVWPERSNSQAHRGEGHGGAQHTVGPMCLGEGGGAASTPEIRPELRADAGGRGWMPRMSLFF
jgi:hypothetical protein